MNCLALHYEQNVSSERYTGCIGSVRPFFLIRRAFSFFVKADENIVDSSDDLDKTKFVIFFYFFFVSLG